MQKVEAYKDESGELHDSELGAARADAKLRLEKLLGGKDSVCVTAIMTHADDVFVILSPLCFGREIGLHELANVRAKPIPELDAKDLTDEQRERYPNTVGPL